jgi:hypothetical protein
MKRPAKTPTTEKLNAAKVKKAVGLAASGAPSRLIALALGYSTAEYKAWLAVGQEEDEWEEAHGGLSKASLKPERWLALNMVRELRQAQAEYAVKLCRRLTKACMKGDGYSLRWWLERMVPEFHPKNEPTNTQTNNVKVVFNIPDNGRMPKPV